MTTWSDLVSVAVVGTERRPVPPALATDVAAALGAALPPASPEGTVLAAAGVLAAYRRTGWTPAHDERAADASPPDDRALASPAATQLLELLLDGQITIPGGAGFLVGEWLERAAATGRRPPDRLLPRLLAAATADGSQRAAALAAGGPRLRWLAGRNPDWAWAVTPLDDGAAVGEADIAVAWATGARDQRILLLTSLRASRPDDARRLGEETWSGENARDRATIVAALATGLGPDDEPFLEAALDDRAKAVRHAARDLLVQIPSSRLAGRMADRLRPLVSVGGRIRKKLDVVLPETVDDEARRDGVVDTGAPAQTGPRSWWLIQIVAATPLRFWEEHLGLDPAAVVRLAADRDLRHGLLMATRTQHDSRWAAALLPHQPDPPLLALLPPSEAAAALGPVLAAVKDPAVPAALEAMAGPWSAATSAAAISRLRAAKTTGPLQQAVPVLATRLHPSAAADLERWVDDRRDDDYARRHVRGLAHALSIRHAIAQELS